MGQCIADRLQYSIQSHFYLLIDEAQRAESPQGKPAITLTILCDASRMMAPIDFHNKLRLKATKIHDEPVDHVLPAEPGS